MRVNYTGRQVDLAPAQLAKLQAEFDKVARLLDTGKGECLAHVRITQERHLNVVEVNVHYHGHDLVGDASDAELFTAIHAAVARLETQAIRVKNKWRDSHRTPNKETASSKGAAVMNPLGEISQPAT